MRAIVEFFMRIWPINRLMTLVWRYMPFPRGARSSIMRRANDWFMVGVMAVIHDGSGRLFLVRNTYDPRFDWSLPGGWMGRKEQPAECIVREIREETGYEIEVGELLQVHTHNQLPSIDLVFRARIAGGEFRPSAEINDARFFALDDLPDGLTPIHLRLIDGLPDGREDGTG